MFVLCHTGLVRVGGANAHDDLDVVVGGRRQARRAGGIGRRVHEVGFGVPKELRLCGSACGMGIRVHAAGTVRRGVRDLASLAVGLLYDTALDAIGDVFS